MSNHRRTKKIKNQLFDGEFAFYRKSVFAKIIGFLRRLLFKQRFYVHPDPFILRTRLLVETIIVYLPSILQYPTIRRPRLDGWKYHQE